MPCQSFQIISELFRACLAKPLQAGPVLTQPSYALPCIARLDCEIDGCPDGSELLDVTVAFTKSLELA